MSRVKIKVIRYGVPMERESETLEQAMRSAFHDVDYNTASPVEIIDGDKVYDREAMRLWWEHRNFYDD